MDYSIQATMAHAEAKQSSHGCKNRISRWSYVGRAASQRR